MSRAPPTSETQPLAVELARERLRKQAVADLLARMNTDPEAISHALGGELWLILTRSAFDRIADGQTEGSSTDELIDEVCRDLGRACHLALERDRQGDGPVLKINSESWYLLVKPGRPAWLVVTIRPQVEFRRFVHRIGLAVNQAKRRNYGRRAVAACGSSRWLNRAAWT